MEHAFKITLPSPQNRSPISQIGQIIFYTILQCLDIMMDMKKHRFKCYPEITSEHSQYLAMHTDYEANKKLGEQLDDLVERQKKIPRMLKRQLVLRMPPTTCMIIKPNPLCRISRNVFLFLKRRMGSNEVYLSSLRVVGCYWSLLLTQPQSPARLWFLPYLASFSFCRLHHRRLLILALIAFSGRLSQEFCKLFLPTISFYSLKASLVG